MATLTSATNNGVDLGLGGGISDEEEEDATIIPNYQDNNNVNNNVDSLNSNNFITSMKKIGYREQAALIQENLAQSSFDRGFMKSFKEAFEKNQEKGINIAKECIEQQLK